MGMRPTGWVALRLPLASFQGLKLGAGNNKGLWALFRTYLCMPARGQDAVAALTFQAEAVPVFAEGAHFLSCGEQDRTRLQEAGPNTRRPPFTLSAL